MLNCKLIIFFFGSLAQYLASGGTLWIVCGLRFRFSVSPMSSELQNFSLDRGWWHRGFSASWRWWFSRVKWWFIIVFFRLVISLGLQHGVFLLFHPAQCVFSCCWRSFVSSREFIIFAAKFTSNGLRKRARDREIGISMARIPGSCVWT